MKKGLLFLLFILILPSVNAFLDLRGIYNSYPQWFDFVIFFAMFGVVARIAFGKIFGREEPLHKALSLVVAFALAFAGVYVGYLSLSGLGESPIVWLLIFVFLFVGLYGLINSIFKKWWLSLLITILISLFLIYVILPGSVLQKIPLDMSFIGYIASFLGLLFMIFVIFCLVFWGSKKVKEWSSKIPDSGPGVSDKDIKGRRRRGKKSKKARKRKEKKRKKAREQKAKEREEAKKQKMEEAKKLKAFIINPIPGLNRIIRVEPEKVSRFIGKAEGGNKPYRVFRWFRSGQSLGSVSAISPSRSKVDIFFNRFMSGKSYTLAFEVTDSDRAKANSIVYVYVEKEEGPRQIPPQQRVSPRVRRPRGIRQILQQQRVSPRVRRPRKEEVIQKQDRQLEEDYKTIKAMLSRAEKNLEGAIKNYNMRARNVKNAEKKYKEAIAKKQGVHQPERAYKRALEKANLAAEKHQKAVLKHNSIKEKIKKYQS